jgi:hypothetical protein
MDVSVEFEAESKKLDYESFIWSLLGRCVSTQIHPDEKDFEKRIVKILPENIKSKIEVTKISINGKVYDKTKTLEQNQVKQGAIVMLTVKENK